MSCPEKTSNLPVDLPVSESYASHSQQNSGFPPPGRHSPMQHESGFFKMLATLYPSPAEDAKWARVVDQLCKLISLSAAFLISFNPRLAQQETSIRGGAEFMEEGQALYNDYY